MAIKAWQCRFSHGSVVSHAIRWRWRKKPKFGIANDNSNPSLDGRLCVGGDPFGTNSGQARVRLTCCYWHYTNLLRPRRNRVRGSTLVRYYSWRRCHVPQLIGVIVARSHLHIGAIPALSVATPKTPKNNTDNHDPLPT